MNLMNGISGKLSIFVVLAILFGATMIALSMKDHRHSAEATDDWSKTKSIDRTFAVKSGDKLVLDADEGDVIVTGSETREMVVHIYQKGSQEYLNNYHVDLNQSGDVVTIRSRMDKKLFHLFDEINCDIRYEIQLPKEFNLKMQTSGGDLRVENVSGSIHGETSGGDVEGKYLEGNISLSTSGGNMKLLRSKGDLDMVTSGGDISGEDVVGTLRVETSGGSIKFRKVDGALHATTSGGDIRVELDNNKGVDLSTSGGNVVVSLPKSVAANIDAETTGGEITCDFTFAGKLVDGSLKGKINGGGESINLETSGGDIVIHAVE